MRSANHASPLTSSALELLVCDGTGAFPPGGDMTETQTASRQITEEVTSWPGVEAGPGRRGELARRVGRREIGHLHGGHAAHFSFPKDVWGELHEQGRIVDHPVGGVQVGAAAGR